MQTTDPDARALQLRISTLERQLKAQRWQFAAAIVVVLFVVWLLLPSIGATIEAETFVLTDASGVRRAEMSIVLDEPTVTFYDTSGQLQGALRINESGVW